MSPEKDPNTAALGDNPIEEQMDLLCEELEITKDLLTVLKKEKLVEDNIKAEIDKQGGRAKKIKFLLNKLKAQKRNLWKTISRLR